MKKSIMYIIVVGASMLRTMDAECAAAMAAQGFTVEQEEVYTYA